MFRNAFPGLTEARISNPEGDSLSCRPRRGEALLDRVCIDGQGMPAEVRTAPFDFQYERRIRHLLLPLHLESGDVENS